MQVSIKKYKPSKNNKILFAFEESDVKQYYHYPACPVCGVVEDWRTAVEIGGAHWQAVVKVVQCQQCSHVYYLNPPCADMIKDYYQANWNQTEQSFAKRNQVKTTPKNKIAQLVQDLKISDKTINIVDIGCGNGGNLLGLKASGFTNLHGSELSQHRAITTEQLFPGRIYQGGYESLPQQAKFDFIYSNHVVEHIYNPKDCFAKLKDHLTDNGVIAIAVPNALYETVIGQVLFLPHLHSFSSESLRVLGAQYGFKAIAWQGARVDEIVYVFYKNDSLIAKYDQAKFANIGPITTVEKDFLFDRIKQLWLETVHKPAVISEIIPGVVKCKDTLRRSYVKLNGFQHGYMRLLATLARLFAKLRLRSLSVKLLGFLKFVSKPGNEIKNFGYMELRQDGQSATGVPRVAMNEKGIFIIK